jgi:hypothetical protein
MCPGCAPRAELDRRKLRDVEGKKGTQVHPRNPENSKLRNCLLPVPDLVFRYYNYNYKKQYSTLT